MTPTQDLSTWFNDAQACQELGCTPRTLDRKARAGELQPQKRQRQGKPAERVFDPVQISALKLPRGAEVLPPTSDKSDTSDTRFPTRATPPTTATRTTPATPPNVGMSELPEGGPTIRTMDDARMVLQAALEVIAEQQQPAEPTLWVDLRQASEITGLSVVFLSGLVKSGALRAVRDRMYRKDGEERQNRRKHPLIVIKVLRESLEELDVRAELVAKPRARRVAKP